VKQAALAIGRAAKAEGLSPQSAAQIAAAGAQEAAKKNQQSQAEGPGPRCGDMKICEGWGCILYMYNLV